MKITILCDNRKSWIVPYLDILNDRLLGASNDSEVVYDINDITSGDVMFILSCENILSSDVLEKHSENYVVHESALPKGRGWSPLTWQVLEGETKIPITLCKAEEQVDSGDIYMQEFVTLTGNELNEQLKHLQGMATVKIIVKFTNNKATIVPTKQMGDPTYYAKRTPKDSELNIRKTLDEQFNLLRVVDNERYPAFFYKDGHKYVMKVYKVD